MNRFDSKVLPSNVSLESLLKPRGLIKLNKENPVVHQDESQNAEAKEYMQTRYGNDVSYLDNESIPAEIKEIMTLALENYNVSPVIKQSPAQVFYRFDLGFRNGKYHGSTDDCFTRSIVPSFQTQQRRTIDQEERHVLNNVIGYLNSSVVAKKKADHNAEKKKPLIAPTMDDDDEDIFEDAGTDYVCEPEAKKEKKSKNSYFIESDEKIENSLKVEVPVEIEGTSKLLSNLMQNSHKIKRKNSDSDSENNSIHELADIVDDSVIDYDYGNFYSSDEDEGKGKGLVSKLNQELQQVGNVYKAKFGEKLDDAESKDAIEKDKKPRKKKKKTLK